MSSRSFIIFLVAFCSMAIIANAQIPKRTPYPPSKINRDSNDEKLNKVSIKLEIEGAKFENNSKFKISKEKDVIIRVLATVSDNRIIAFGFAKDQKTLFTPLLLGNNDSPFSYPTKTQEKIREAWREVERKKAPNELVKEGGASTFISPNQENLIGRLNIADWYGKLGPGIYRVVVLFGFGENEREKKIQSNVITFEIY